MEQIVAAVLALVGMNIVVATANAIVSRSHWGPLRWFWRATSIVGVPVHELSHWLMANLMGFRVNRTVLLQWSNPDMPMGWVEYSYPTRGLTVQLRLFLVGLAPAVVFAIIFSSISAKLFPGLPGVAADAVAGLAAGHWAPAWGLVAALAAATAQDAGTAAILLLLCVTAMHAAPSWADLRSAVPGGIMLICGAGVVLGLLGHMNHGQQLAGMIAGALASALAVVGLGAGLAAALAVIALIASAVQRQR